MMKDELRNQLLSVLRTNNFPDVEACRVHAREEK
jgi:hypothetical protein